MDGEKASPALKYYPRRTGLIQRIFDVQEGSQVKTTTRRKERSVLC
jgi:hypothetical protein